MKRLALMCAVAFSIACQTNDHSLVKRTLLVKQMANYESIPVIDSASVVSKMQDVPVSAFGANKRKWEPGQLTNFFFPALWLNNPEELEKEVYIIKHVGKSLLFCLIEPDKVEYKSGTMSAEYSIFLVKKISDTQPDWEEFLSDHYGSAYYNHREIDLGRFTAVQINWNVDFYWNAPIVLIKLNGNVYEMVQIYRGLARSYVNQIFNKFPWRAFTHN